MLICDVWREDFSTFRSVSSLQLHRLIDNLNSNSKYALVGNLQLQFPLGLGGLHGGLERGEHGLGGGEHLLVVRHLRLPAAQRLQARPRLGLQLPEVSLGLGGQGREQPQQGVRSRALLLLKAAAKILDEGNSRFPK